MKRLVAVVMMIAIATFMAAPPASAQDRGWGAIQETYGMIASGSCLHSILGFTFEPASVYSCC